MGLLVEYQLLTPLLKSLQIVFAFAAPVFLAEYIKSIGKTEPA